MTVTSTGEGGCSLRAAIQAVAANDSGTSCGAVVSGGATPINLPANTITPFDGQIVVPAGVNIEINGDNVNNPLTTVIDGTGGTAGRVFEIKSGATVKLSGLTVTGGHSFDGADSGSIFQNFSGENGGGILNQGSLTLSHVVVQGNQAGDGGDGANGGLEQSGGAAGWGGNGGGIYNADGASLTISDSLIDDNLAGSDGVDTLRGNDGNHDHWWPFYFGQSQKTVPTQPSPFAQWFLEREPTSTQIVDIGTGTGRDALWFARQGRDVLGLDYVPAATERAGIIADDEDLPARFKTLNLYDIRQVLGIGGELSHRDEPPVLYGRFLIHALRDDGRHNLWRIANMSLRRGGKFYLEFRTGLDSDAEHEFGEHFRRYLDPETVIAEIEATGGHIEHCEAGHGLAVYKQEDPHVCRLVATWKR